MSTLLRMPWPCAAALLLGAPTLMGACATGAPAATDTGNPGGADAGGRGGDDGGPHDGGDRDGGAPADGGGRADAGALLCAPSIRAGAENMACMAGVLTAPWVCETRTASDLPLPEGGTVEPGVYVLTGLVRHNMPARPVSAARQQLTLEAQGTFQVVYDAWDTDLGSDVSEGPRTEVGTWRVEGTDLVLDMACPVSSVVVGYTATPATLRRFIPFQGLVQEFTRQ